MSSLSNLSNVPLWALLLVLAGAAPWCAGLLQSILVERRRERTRALLRSLGLPEGGSAHERRASKARATSPAAPRDEPSEHDEDT
jgi:hypothetical protein